MADTQEHGLKEAKREIAAAVHPGRGLIHITFWKLMWIFVVASVVGLVLEDIFHVILYGGYESRAGMVWGPFSPIYGFGAALLTLFLNRFWHSHNVIIFTIAMIVGSTLEFVTSLGLELLFGAVAWDYSGTFGSIAGRTNFVFGVMWGLLGLAWVRIVLPGIKLCFDKVDFKNRCVKIVSIAMLIFLVIDGIITIGAFNRQSERANDIPASTPIQQFYDDCFPADWMGVRFHMTIYGRGN